MFNTHSLLLIALKSKEEANSGRNTRNSSVLLRGGPTKAPDSIRLSTGNKNPKSSKGQNAARSSKKKAKRRGNTDNPQKERELTREYAESSGVETSTHYNPDSLVECKLYPSRLYLRHVCDLTLESSQASPSPFEK